MTVSEDGLKYPITLLHFVISAHIAISSCDMGTASNERLTMVRLLLLPALITSPPQFQLEK